MKIQRIFLLSILFILLCNNASSQFTDVTVHLDTRLLRGSSEDYLLQDLKEQVESYYLISIFAPEAMDLDLVLDIRLVIESVTEGNNRKLISGQALFSNLGDQQYFAKGFEFPYVKGQSMVFTPTFNPVDSFFDYFAFLVIAGELDTYDEFGGNVYYGKAQGLAYIGKSAAYSRGWDTRWKRLSKIMDNLELRQAKFQFYQAYDLVMSEKIDKDELIITLDKFMSHLQNANYEIGFDRYMEVFLNSHADEIGSMMKAAGMTVTLKNLIELDVNNTDIYQSYLPAIKTDKSP